ncbi:unnamed protein product [Sympodiomycopsis kandeliae]
MSNKAQYMREIYLGGTQGVKPSFTTATGSDLEREAKEKCSPEAYGYVAGAASSESTVNHNRKALDDWQIVPSMLGGVEITEFDSSTTLFGRKFPTPLIISPIGVQEQLHKEADLATAKAASELEVPFTLSSAGSFDLETVMKETDFDTDLEPDQGGNEAWYQLYWPNDDKLTESLLTRAKKAGYKALVITLDTWILGWRPRDLNTAYNPFLTGKGLAQVWSDPYFISEYCEGQDPRGKDVSDEDRLKFAVTAVSLLNPGISRSWDDLKIIRSIWGQDLPIILKGIQSVEDTTRALNLPHGESHIDAIWVSNHGGRQVDGAIGSLQSLETIASMCHARGKTVIFDSGVRNGADILKALALGADAVGIGRPYAWGLALDGQEGVKAVLKALLADMELNAALSGCKSVKEFTRNRIVRSGERL